MIEFGEWLMHRDVEWGGGSDNLKGDNLKGELSRVLAEESLWLTDEQKAAIRENADTLAESNKFYNATFLDKILSKHWKTKFSSISIE